MKLTNYTRDAFVDAALQDVPKIDYEQKIKDAALADIVANMPETVRAVWNDEKTRGYVDTTWMCRTNEGKSIHGVFPKNGVMPILSVKGSREVEKLLPQSKAQDEQRAALRAKIKGAAYACTTRKALAEMLPEFVRYLPAEADPSPRSLPVVANIVADFAAAGWPKDGKKEKSV